MVNAKGKGNASTSNSSPRNSDAAVTALTETTVSSPMKTNLEEVMIVSESEDKVENLMEEGKNVENAIVLGKKEANAIEEEEEKNEENAIEEEEKNEEAAIEEEKAREGQNEEKVDLNSKEVVKKSRKRSRRRRVARGASKTVHTKDEDKPESSGKKKASKKAESMGKMQGEPKTVDAKDENKPESSGKKKASKKVESMGMIFMCSSKTKKDCYRYKVLGLPANKRDIVQKIYKGMRLFLFDFDLRLMYGIYKAAGPGGYNIESKAFKSAFPSQVRFTVLEDCLPLAEEKFKKVIKDNYYSKNKFNCELSSEQVKKLCDLFVAASKGPKSKNLSSRSLRAETHTFVDRRRNLSSRSLRAEAHTFVDRDRIRRRGIDEERRPAFGGEHRYHEREVFASPVAPLPRVPALPPPAPVPSYAYERTWEMDAYRRDPLVEHRDFRLLDLKRRHRDEMGSRDPYISYREPPSYHDPVYSAGIPPDYHQPAGLRPEYRHVGPLIEYHSSAGSPTEYHPRRPLYRY